MTQLWGSLLGMVLMGQLREWEFGESGRRELAEAGWTKSRDLVPGQGSHLAPLCLSFPWHKRA